MTTNSIAFNIDQAGPIAAYVQIQNQIQFAITSGSIKKGDALPSVRDLSSKLDLNPNTITKAYRDLEIMGLVVTRRGIGVNVSEEALKLCKKRVHEMVKRHLRDAVGECTAAGITAAQVIKLTSDTISSGYRPYGSSEQRSKRARSLG